MPKYIKNRVEKTFLDSISVKQQIINKSSYEVLIEAGGYIADFISNGEKLPLFGNGGSSADALHLREEFLIRLTSDTNRERLVN